MRDSELEYIELTKEAPLRLIIVSLESSSPHWHEEYEVVFVLRGSVSVSVGNEPEYELHGGDILLINPRDVHAFRKKDGGNICLILQFSPVVIAEVYQNSFMFRLNTSADEFLSGEIISEFRRLLSQMGLLFSEKPDGYQFSIKSGLYAFIGLLFRHLKYETAINGNSAQTEEYLQDFDIIKRYIKEHFKEMIDQTQIARTLGMSRAKVYRVLRAAGGASTKDMTNFYRVEYAKHQLKSTAHSIPFIAEESGFESDSSFYRIFRDMTGTTPRKFRESPARKVEAVGIQGYAQYSLPESLTLLRGFAQ